MPNISQPTASETGEKLRAYANLLLKWNQKINLIGKTTEKELWQRHIEDSRQLVDFIPAGAKTVTDLGSGAGLPGLVIATLRPDLRVNLVESDYRKCAFMKEAARLVEIPNAIIHNARIEVLKPLESDVIMARAFAPLDVILRVGGPFAGPDTSWVLLKGKTAADEVRNAQKSWQFDHFLTQSSVKPREVKEQGYVLTIQNVRPI